MGGVFFSVIKPTLACTHVYKLHPFSFDFLQWKISVGLYNGKYDKQHAKMPFWQNLHSEIMVP